MKILFEYDVDFMENPMEPPVRGNCEKCAFFKNNICITKQCNYGRNGYFVLNKLTEVINENRKT